MIGQYTSQEEFNMANLQQLQDFAEKHKFGLTAPLSHKQVESLAKQWLPQIFFFEQEKFHPIALEQKNSMIRDLFDGLPENVKEAWRVNLLVRTGENTGAYQAFNPPVVRVPDGNIVQENPNQPTIVRKVYRALNHGGITFEQALEENEADENAVITHGANFERSDHFFGAQETVLGGNVPKKGDPFRPRAEENGQPLMTVYASYKNLLETLKYEVAVEKYIAEENPYPSNALRGGFDTGSPLFIPSTEADPFPPEVQRDVLLELIAAFEANESLDPALQKLPAGWELNEVLWQALTRYAFLEFEFFYAYNDFERVQDTFFDNEHEGDNEGCCLVFDRKLINLVAEADDPDNPRLLLLVVPESIITSVHEEQHESDLFKRIPTLHSPPDDPEELKKLVNLAVYVAWGSHATYLTSGSHGLVDFQDMVDFVEDKIPLPLLLAFPEYVLALLIIALIIEHFDDPQDLTSEDGIRSVPEGTSDEDPVTVSTKLNVMPMSLEDHIYQRKDEYRELLRLRSFAGKWGAHDTLVNHSPKYNTKTGRYFRKLLKNL
jgi:hypothetical protein